MATSGQRVFLSYRREDSAGHAGRLADHLLDRFGQGSVFVDVESIEAGADFSAEIEGAISDSEAVLVVIGPGWLDAKATSGTRRLDEPADFVRREIEAALASQVRVVPVLVGGASMPTETELPPSIAPLSRRNAVELQDRRWREDVDALIDVLEGRGRGALGNLPPQPTPFLGRDRELAEITELLRRQEVRLLTLTGPGGIGKTRLAVQVASRLAHIYPGGAWFVGLAALRAPGLVLSEVARVLKVRDAPEDRLVAAIAERVARARTLLILDNLEQLLPDGARAIAELSAAALSLECIVSSREPLRASGEREFPVPPLTEDEALALFLASARAVDPHFAQSDGSERGIALAICARLDRLPLAIELAAARTRLLEPAALLERLEQRLQLLTGGARDLPERQRTLRATIAWSYDLLSQDEHDLFERLAIFSGGWTLEAAEAVCDADLDTLQALVERSLVRHEGTRSTMLETIREFALEQFEARPDAGGLRRRHAEHYRAVAEAADRELRGRNQARWLDRLDAELDNFRAAMQWGLDGPDPELGMRIALALCMLWYFRGPVSEGRKWLEEALECGSPVASEARARALNWVGYFAGEQGEEATSLLEESIRCAREAGAVATEALATSYLSVTFRPGEPSTDTVPLGRRAVDLARTSGDRWVLAVALNNLGVAYQEGGDDAAAFAAFEESYALGREIGDSARMALPLANLAEMSIAAGDLDRAKELSREALDLAEALGDRKHTAFALSVLGWSALAMRNLDEAGARFGRSLELLRELGHSQTAVTVLFGVAGTAAAAGDVARAARMEAAATRLEAILGHIPSAADFGIYQRYLDELRDMTDPIDWPAAAREGEAMSLEEAIAFALGSRVLRP
jgi:predicted ATPase